MKRDGTVVSPKRLKEGIWKTLDVLREGYGDRIRKRWEGEPRARLAAEGLRDTVRIAAGEDGVKGLEKGEGREGLESMDVWWVLVGLGG